MISVVRRLVEMSFLLWVLWLPGFSHASSQDSPAAYFRLEPHYLVYPYSADSHTFHQVLHSTRWNQVPGLSINQGYNDHALWLRFDVEVQTGAPLSTFLELGSPFLDTIDFYLVFWQGGMPRLLDQQTAGDHQEFNQRLQRHRYPLFGATFPHSGRYSLFVRVKSSSTLMFEAALYGADSFFQQEIQNQVFYGMYFGVILVLAYFNLMLMMYLRERTFQYNFFFITSIGIYQAGLSGFGYRYLWQGDTFINDHVFILSGVTSFFFGGMFAIQFMELKMRAPLFYRIAKVLMVCFWLPAFLTPFLPEKITMLILQSLSIITAVYAFAVMGHQVLQKNTWALYLLLGWSITIGGYSVYVASMFGWLAYGAAAQYIQAIGLGLGNVLVTTAIAARVRHERRERDSALRHALDLSQEVARLTQEKEQIENTANLQLQREFEQKTHELNQMLDSLQKSNRRLEQDSRSDPLTGLHNRRYLDVVFPDIIAQCIRHRSSLGVLVIDADHFKRINDTFGHLAGDDVLRKLATILQKYSRRNLDTLVRYGGEEFVMLLPATDLEGVMKVAESIRHHVQYAQFWFEDQRVPVTVSMGVHVCIPPIHATPENLMHKADEALYQAKHNGRNRIEVAKARFEVVKA